MSSYGWKKNFNLKCVNLTGKLFIACVEGAAYSNNEIFTNANMSNKVQIFFTDFGSGLVHSFRAEMAQKSNSPLVLNPFLMYRIIIIDKKLEMTNLNPDLFPRSILMLRRNTGSFEVYLKVNT